LIAGFLNPDSGEIRPTHDYWPVITYKPERLLFPNQFRVSDYLAMIAQLSGMSGARAKQSVREALEQVKLTESATKRIGQCSKGMRQRLALAQALIGEPQVLLLDEPSNGLDPEGQVDIQRLIRRIGLANQTVILSSHHLEEVTQTCDYLIILKQGRIHYKGSMEEALSLRPHVTIQVDRDLEPAAEMLMTLHHDIVIDGPQLILTDEAIRLRRQILSILVSGGYDIVGVAQKRTTLEEIYAEAVQWHNES
jgi:ABC-2 type transport system ATP-binding protein